MPRARMTVSALATATLLAFVPVAIALSFAAAGGAAWAGAAGEQPAPAPLLDIAPLDPRIGNRKILRVEMIEGLNFGKVVAGAGRGGEVVLDPATGRKTARAGAFDLGGHDSRAQFIVRGKPNTRFAILLPDRIELAGSRGSVAMTRFTSSPERVGIIGPGGTATVYVAATLELGRIPAAGAYHGSFSILLDRQ